MYMSKQGKGFSKYYVVALLIVSCSFYTLWGQAALAFSEVESVTTFRSDKKSLSLPLLAVHVSANASQNTAQIEEALAPLLGTALSLVESQKQASVILSVSADNTVQCTSAIDPSFQSRFTLPQEKERFLQNILAYAHSLGVRSLQGSTAFEDVIWSVHMWEPARAGESGAQNIYGEFWKPTTDISVSEKNVTTSYQGRTLLSFSFTNNSPENFYAYLLNATNTGQVIPILAPETLNNAQNTLLMQKKHMVENIYLELGSPEEQVLLILSREPLAFHHWQQENFEGITQSFLRASTSPSAENWSSRKLTYIQK